MQCIKCGKENTFTENICKECFSAELTIAKISETIDLNICVHCSSLQIRNWEDIEFEKGIKKIIHKNLKTNYEINEDVELIYEDERNIKAIVNISCFINNENFEQQLTTKIRVKNSVCQTCSRIRGNYFEGIIQIRAKDRGLKKEEIEKIKKITHSSIEEMHKNDKNVFLTKEIIGEKGIDFYVGTKNSGRIIARKIAERFSANYLESVKFAGVRDGKNEYRITFRVRIPSYSEGDFIEKEKKLFFVKDTHGKVKLFDFEEGREEHFRPKNLEDALVVGNEEMIKNAVVLSESEKELQLLDPDNYKMLSVKKPKNYKKKESVKIVKHREEVYLFEI